MPFGSLKLLPGVDVEKTPSLNEAGISTSQLIRFRDGLPEKVGGWVKYFNGVLGTVIRELHAWQDLSGVTHLAIGASDGLQILTNGNANPITPQKTQVNISPSFTTVSTTNLVEVFDTGRNASIYDVAVLNTPVAVGGLILSGAYQVVQSGGANAYYINSAFNATSSVTTGGAVPSFTTTSGSPTVKVTLVGHGQSVGSSFPFIAPTTGAGVTIQGLYFVSSVIDADNFTINVSNQANAGTSFSMNGGNVQIDYYIGIGPPPVGSGFGILGFGRGGFGTGTPPVTTTGTPITATDWTTVNWGEILISCPQNGPIFTWSPESGIANSSIIPTAPLVNSGIFIAMPEQILVAWGSSTFGVQDPLLIKWCDVANYVDWVGTTTNQAGTYRIPSGSAIIGALQGPQQGLIWTDLDVWAMQYVGAPFVFGFTKLATGCGLIGSHAACVIGNSVFWMSQKQFYVLNGPNMQPVPCPIWDAVFQNLDTANAWKIRAGVNSQFNEVIWYYPSLNGNGENDSYVKYNIVSNAWDYGTLARTAWIDQSVLGSPLGSDAGGYIYQHEVGYNNDALPMQWSFSTGWFTLSDGEEFTFVDWMMPDMKWGTFGGAQTATVQITLNVANYPGDTPVTYGPFSVNQMAEYFEPRFRGRLVSFNVSGSDINSFARLGNIRYRYASDGRVG